MPRAPLITWPANRKQMRVARRGPGCGSGSHRAAARAPLAAAVPRPHAPDLGWRRPLGRSRGHMAEGDAGSDQRQVRARRGADLQAGLGVASPPRASSAEGPSAGGRPRSRRHRLGRRALRLLHRVPFYLRLFADRPPTGLSRGFGRLGLPRTVSSSTIRTRLSSTGPETEIRVQLSALSPPGHLGQATYSRFLPLQNGQ